MDFLFIQEQDQNPEIIPYACGKNAPCKGCSGCSGCRGGCKGCTGSLFVG